MGNGPLAVGKKWFHAIVVVGASITAPAGCSSVASTDAGAPDSAHVTDAGISDVPVDQSSSSDGGTTPQDAQREYPNILIPYR